MGEVLEGTLPLEADDAKAVTSRWGAQMDEVRATVSDGSRGLPSYDLEASQQTLAKLREDLDAARARVTPKRRFAFGKKRKAKAAEAAAGPAPAETGAAETAAAAAAATALLERLGDDEVTVSGLSDQVVTLGEDGGGDVRLMDLSRCTVLIRGRLSALRVDRLTDCTVLALPVAGSVLLHDCKGCDVHMAARQFRLHRSEACRFFVLALSRPIVEHCSGLGFAPYVLAPGGDLVAQRELLLAAGLLESADGSSERDAATADNWRRVDDFGWIKSTASPNWRELDSAEWPTTLPAAGLGAGLGLVTAARPGGATASVAEVTEGTRPEAAVQEAEEVPDEDDEL